MPFNKTDFLSFKIGFKADKITVANLILKLQKSQFIILNFIQNKIIDYGIFR